MKAGKIIFQSIFCLIISCAIFACTKQVPAPIVPPLPEVTKTIPPAKVIKDHYIYELKPALCADTQQFLASEAPVSIPAPEKAINFNLQGFFPSSSEPKLKPANFRKSPDLINNALTVFFGLNSSVINAREAVKLNQFIKKLPRGAEAAITGYTCRLGSAEYNQKLALDRAAAVSSYLTKNGVRVQSAIGTAGCCYISDTDPSKNRRAEIQVVPS